MTIYDFVELLNNGDEMIFSVFDCNNGDLISIATDDGERYGMNKDELLWSNVSNYEVQGVDTWFDEKENRIHVEFNIDYEGEDEEDDD